MSQHEWVLFFAQMGLLSSMALAGGFVMRKLKYPSVLGELLGGILIGPGVLGMLAPGLFNSLFREHPTINTSREVVLTIGMLFFLFATGLELNLTRLREHTRAIVLTSLLGMVIPFGLGFGAVLAFPSLWGTPLQTQGWMLPFFIGTALCISALPVIARILTDMGLLQSELGGIIISAAVIDDLIGWSLFAASLSLINSADSGSGVWVQFAWLLAIIVVIWALSRWLVKPFLRWVQRVFDWTGGLIALVAIWIFGAAAVAELLGLHPVLGAFQVGVALGQGLESDRSHPAYETIRQFAISFFAPLYFVSVGLKANFVSHFDLTLVLVVVLIACLGKMVGASLGAWLGGRPMREAIAVGSGLNARGAIEIILASVALEYKIIDERIFVALVIMALVTSVMSGPLIRSLLPHTVSQ